MGKERGGGGPAENECMVTRESDGLSESERVGEVKKRRSEVGWSLVPAIALHYFPAQPSVLG